MSASFATASMTAAASSAKPSHLEARVANDLDALWRSIFERAHADETHGESGNATVSHAPLHESRGGRAFTNDRGAAPDAKTEFSPPRTPLFAAPETGEAIEIAPARRAGSPTVASVDGARASDTADPETPLAGLPSSTRIPSDENEFSSSPTEQAPPEVIPERVYADETVSVFMNGGAVIVNVRDAALTAGEALRCAFETAHTLTGERAALRLLTLNGRTVYAQAPRPADAISPALVFAC